MDQASVDGSIYALPVNNVMYGIYCSKTLMEEQGWELPTNFAELKEQGAVSPDGNPWN